MAKITKEYNIKRFCYPEEVTTFLNNNQDEIYVEAITHNESTYTVFYYKKIYK